MCIRDRSTWEYLFIVIKSKYYLPREEKMLDVLISLFVIALFLLLIWKVFLEEQKKNLNLTIKMTPEQYEQHKQETTRLALENLKKSPEYQQYLRSKENGEFPNIYLDREEEINEEEEESSHNLINDIYDGCKKRILY
eukprot:TRINITY_DN8572_c0_g2_i1.p2 TRINITY_DN8572_c0_g2~~TRINITY_DN8572_c0_g2_i1.p2  ORF type:complete len:138 (+),score=21.62 TRINITY_DN8572_c0_g2_i1:64-477(+)